MARRVQTRSKDGSMQKLFPTILHNQSGNVLPIGTAGMMVLLALVGSGVEMSRAYRAEQRLQAACDSAVLAGRRSVGSDGFDEEAEQTARSYFNANFHEERLEANNTQFTASSDDNGNTVTGTATTSVSTLIMNVFGFRQIDLTAACTASMGFGNSDITMVLDTTGSMNSTLSGTSMTRIEALREAMMNFYDTVATSTAASNARIRYAFVPYSSTVNVGQILLDLDPDYLADSTVVQSRTAVDRTVTNQVFVGWGDPVSSAPNTTFSTASWTGFARISTRYSTDAACGAALPANTGWSNNGTPTTSTNTVINSSGQQVTTTTVTQPQTALEHRCSSRFIERRTGSRNAVTTTSVTRDPVHRTETSVVFDFFRYEPVTFDTRLYKTFEPIPLRIGDNGTWASFLWDGCIEERSTTNSASFSFSSLTGISPSSATDLDIDTPPTASVASSKWRPLLRRAAYFRTTSSSGSTPTNNATSLFGQASSTACPRAARLMAEMTEQEFDAYAASLTPQGGTYHDIGLIWGARLSSPQGMFSDLLNEDPDNGAEVARHMLFMTDGIMEPNRLTHSAYGVEFHDRRITTDGSTAAATSRHNSRFLAVCEAVKAKGIRLWVIVFDSALTTPLQTCSSPDSIFTANNSTQLNLAFQEIAKKVGELRVIQ